MFFAFDWFTDPRLAGFLIDRVLDWVGGGERLVFSSISPATALERSHVGASDLARLRNLIEQARQQKGSGGYYATADLGAVDGFGLFELSEDGREARLIELIIAREYQEIPPLQLPCLGLALSELLDSNSGLVRVHLPFESTETSSGDDEDFMGVCSLWKGDAGWWYGGNIRVEAPAPGELYRHEYWYEISLTVPPGLLHYASNMLRLFGDRQRLITERVATTTPGQTAINELAPATLRTFLPDDHKAAGVLERLRRCWRPIEASLASLQISRITRDQWSDIWNDFNAYRIGRRILLLIDKEDSQPRPGDITLELVNIKAVFNPVDKGPHPSTRLCLELMEEHLDPAVHTSLLDLGTGTGILSIVAAKMGVAKILALDAYYNAVESAIANIAHNGLSDRIVVEGGSLAVVPPGNEEIYNFSELVQHPPPGLSGWLPFDAILCNTYAHVVMGLAGPMAQALRPGGLLITSGIKTDRADEVTAALARAGFTLLEHRRHSYWEGYAYLRA